MSKKVGKRKLNLDEEDEARPKGKKNVKSTDSEHSKLDQSDFLKGCSIYVLQAGIGKARCDLFNKQIVNNGGTFEASFGPTVTHLVIDEKMDFDRMCRILKIDSVPSKVRVVRSLWLSACLKGKEYVDSMPFDVKKIVPKVQKQEDERSEPEPGTSSDGSSKTEGPSAVTSSATAAVKPEKKYPQVGNMYRFSAKPKADFDDDADSDYVASGEEDEGLNEAMDSPSPPSSLTMQKKLPRGNWVCAQASSSAKVNHNKNITDKLEALAKVYENTNDRWRALGYSKAIAALKRHPKPIATYEEAKALNGVGEKLANKIWEIMESGQLRKLEELSSTEEMKAINLFANIWGAGAATARQWVAMGFRTLAHLNEKANLTKHQKIGLKYYDELMERMSREEAGKIETMVRNAATEINTGLLAICCGSYRRGKPTCGDVDVLITHPDGKSHRGVFSKILNNLKETGFLTDDLVQQEDNGNQRKYMGVCKLPGDNTKHRRLDIIVVPYDEYACALMYFTGSAHFNRSMRNLAGKMNMSLSEHSLNEKVVRVRGEKVNKGVPLPTPTEASVFKHLGLKYRPPEERDH